LGATVADQLTIKRARRPVAASKYFEAAEWPD